MKKKKNSKGKIFVLAGVLTAVLLVAGVIIYINTPTWDPADPQSYYGVSGEEALVFLENEPLEIRGLCRNQELYLPLSYVQENLDSGYYEDKENGGVLYVLPGRTWKLAPGEYGVALLSPVGKEISPEETAQDSFDGIPLVFENGEYYLAAELLEKTTALDVRTYSDPGRIYLEKLPATRKVMTLTGETALRTEEKIKAPVLEKCVSGETVEIIEEDQDWYYVLSAEGSCGFIRKSDVKNLEINNVDQEISAASQSEMAKETVEGTIVLGFDYIDNAIYGLSGLQDHLENRQAVNVFCPTWFVLEGNEGDFNSYEDPQYVELAHENGKLVWGLVENNSGECDAEALFSSYSARQKLISNLISRAESLKLDGLNMDIEGISGETIPDYTEFLRELKQALEGTGLVLSVDTYPPFSWNAVYDLPSVTEAADYVVIMAYDESYDAPGPCASLTFTENCINRSLEIVASDRLILGVPFFTKAFTQTENGYYRREVSMKACETLLEQCTNAVWREDQGCYSGTMSIDGTEYQIWFEEDRSMKLRLSLDASAGMKGIAIWRLFQGTDGVWPMIEEYFGQ